MNFKFLLVYRRDDTGKTTGRVFDRLACKFGPESIFRDVDNIPVGADFRTFLSEAIRRSNLMIAMMGHDWVGAARRRGGERRIDQRGDYLRLELELALENKIPIIPVLVDKASAPNARELPSSIAPIAKLQCYSLGSETFDNDYATLEKVIDRFVSVSEVSNTYTETKLNDNDTGYLFVSYARKDEAFARDITTKLHSVGISVWMDQLNIKSGKDWEDEVEKALQGAAAVLFIMSHTSIASERARDEISFAIDLKKPVIPVRIDECEPPFRLRRFQYADFTYSFDFAFQKLVFDVKGYVLVSGNSPEKDSLRAMFIPVAMQESDNDGRVQQLKRQSFGNWWKWLGWSS